MTDTDLALYWHRELADLRLRLDATERHATDLQRLNDQLRTERDTAVGDLAIARAQLAEGGPVMDLLKPVDRPVWRP